MAEASGPWPGCGPEPGSQRRRRENQPPADSEKTAAHRWPLPVCPLCSITLAPGAADLPLRLVVEGEAKRVSEGHERALHGVGLGFLEGGLMGLAQVNVDAVAGATALPNQGRQTSGGDGDANASGVGDTPARLLVPTYGALGLGNAADGDGLPLPAVKAKDAVRLRDDLPAFQVCHLSAALLPLADIRPIEGCGQGCELLGGEAAGLCRVGLGSRGGFVGCCGRNFGPISGADQLQGRCRPLDGWRSCGAADSAGPVGGRSGDGHGDGKRWSEKRRGVNWDQEEEAPATAPEPHVGGASGP
jgi:hypothetical protein